MKIFKKFRYCFRLSSVFAQKQKKLIFLGLLAGILVFYLAPKISTLLTGKNVEKIGLVGRFAPNDLPLQIQNLISQGLTQIEPDGSIKPALAESWQSEKDGKLYTFILKDNLFWSDGEPVLAKDINYNFSDVKVTPIDERSLQMELREAFSPFPAIVSRPVFKKGLIGTGEYRVKSLDKKGEITEKIILTPHQKDKSTLIYRFYPTEEAIRIAFKLGEINKVEGIAQLGDLETWPKIKITPQPKTSFYVGIFFNTQDTHLSERSLRQSLTYAIKKDYEHRALSPINPNSWAYNPGVKPYHYDLANAQKLFASSQDGIDEADQFRKIELSTVPSLLDQAEIIAKDWQQLGIETEVKVINLIPDDFQAILITQEIPLDPDQYVLWHSTQVNNLSRHKNPKIDKLLEDGRKAFDQEERKDIYFDFQRFLVEETPAAFLYHPTLYTVERE